MRLINEHGLEVGQYLLNLRAAKPIGLRTWVKELYRRAHPPQSPAIPEPSSDTQSIVNHLRRSDVVKLEVTKAWEESSNCAGSFICPVKEAPLDYSKLICRIFADIGL